MEQDADEYFLVATYILIEQESHRISLLERRLGLTDIQVSAPNPHRLLEYLLDRVTADDVCIFSRIVTLRYRGYLDKRPLSN